MRTLALKLTGWIAILACLSGCTDGEAGETGQTGPAGKDALVRTSNEPPGSNCEFGGARIQYGIDDNANGALDAGETDGANYACHGAPGEDGIDGQPGEDGEDGVDGVDGRDSLVFTADEPPGEACAQGGVRFDHGIDTDADGRLSEEEVLSSTYVCHGPEGASGEPATDALISISEEAAGTNCSDGGQRVQSGSDLDGDGALSEGEVDNTSYVCNGTRGDPGVGNLVGVTEELPGINCIAGGLRLDMGRDLDVDGELSQSEVEVTRYLCHGGSAPAGPSSLVNVRAEAAGTNCPAGGQRLDTGLDADRSGSLETVEIAQTQYVCSGENGAVGAPGANGAGSLVVIGDEAAGANCAQGGKRIQAGVDADADAALDPGEVARTDYVCNGAAGATGASGMNAADGLLSVTNEPAGARCANGGKRIEVGTDQNGNDALDPTEISATQYVCNGLDGQDGTNGTSGLSGLISVVDEPAGPNCAAGGESVRYGLDDNRDGVLDAGEVDGTRFVCDGAAGTNGMNGAAGADGLSSLVAVVDEAAGANCESGGERITYGLDDDADGVLDEAEVDGTRYVCDGSAGAAGASGTNGTNGLSSLVRVTAEPAGANCAAGGQRFQSGLDDDRDGTLEAGEVDATAYVCNGII